MLDLQHRIDKRLDQMDADRPTISAMRSRRRRTVQAVAECIADGGSLPDLLGKNREKGLISYDVWMSRHKPYDKNEHVRSAVVEIADMVQSHRAAMKAASEQHTRDEEARLRRVKRLDRIDTAGERLDEILEHMNVHKTTAHSAASFLSAVTRLEREEMEEAPSVLANKILKVLLNWGKMEPGELLMVEQHQPIDTILEAVLSRH